MRSASPSGERAVARLKKKKKNRELLALTKGMAPAIWSIKNGTRMWKQAVGFVGRRWVEVGL